MKTYRMMIILLVSMFLMTSTAFADPNPNSKKPDNSWSKQTENCSLSGFGPFNDAFNPAEFMAFFEDAFGFKITDKEVCGKVVSVNAGAVKP
jgi:hypothetical protein